MEKRYLDKETLKKFISDNRLNETVKNLIFQLNEFLDKNQTHIDYEPIRKLSDALIINSGKLNGLEHDRIIGILDREEQRITLAEVQRAVLIIMDKLPEQFWNFKYSYIELSYKSKLIEGVELLHKQKTNFEYDIFICFSTKDREIAIPIWEFLRGYGLKVFVSDEDLKNSVGLDFLDTIDVALTKSQHLLLLASYHSLNSVYVIDEYKAFYNDFHTKNPNDRLLFAYLLGKTKLSDLPRIFRNRQVAKHPEQIINSLVKDLHIDYDASIKEKKRAELERKQEEEQKAKKRAELERKKEEEHKAKEQAELERKQEEERKAKELADLKQKQEKGRKAKEQIPNQNIKKLKDIIVKNRKRIYIITTIGILTTVIIILNFQYNNIEKYNYLMERNQLDSASSIICNNNWIWNEYDYKNVRAYFDEKKEHYNFLSINTDFIIDSTYFYKYEAEIEKQYSKKLRITIKEHLTSASFDMNQTENLLTLSKRRNIENDFLKYYRNLCIHIDSVKNVLNGNATTVNWEIIDILKEIERSDNYNFLTQKQLEAIEMYKNIMIAMKFGHYRNAEELLRGMRITHPMESIMEVSKFLVA